MMSKRKHLLCIVSLLLSCVSLLAHASTPAQLATKQLLSVVQQGGNKAKVLALIGMGANVDGKDDAGRSLAHLAVLQDDLSLLNILHDNGADIDAVDNYGDTLLHTSIAWERYDIANFLLQHGANRMSKNSRGLTAGQYAQQLQRPAEWLEALQVSQETQTVGAPQEAEVAQLSEPESQAETNAASPEERRKKFSRKLKKAVNNLQYTSKNNPDKKLRKLIDEADDIDFSNKKISESLIKIVIFMPITYNQSATIEIIELMLARGADINISRKNGETPLMWAAYHGYTSIVEFLLANNADANFINKEGETAYDWAKTESIRRMLKEAMDASQVSEDGSQQETQQQEGQTETGGVSSEKEKKYKFKDLIEAFEANDLPKLEAVVADGVDLNRKYTPSNSVGYPDKKTTVTIEAGWTHSIEALKLFIVNGADLNYINNRGHYALYYVVSGIAERYGEDEAIEIVELMLEHDAYINLRDANGHTPLMHAVVYGHPRLVRLLLARGARLDITDNFGETAYDRLLQGPSEKREEIRAILEKAIEAQQEEQEGTSPASEKEQAKAASPKIDFDAYLKLSQARG